MFGTSRLLRSKVRAPQHSALPVPTLIHLSHYQHLNVLEHYYELAPRFRRPYEAQGGVTPLVKGYLQHLGPNLRIFARGDYRLSSALPFEPANTFPASLVDAIAGYHHLIHEIRFMIDSAGCGVAFNLARYKSIANLAALEKPAGLVLLSPTTDWAQTYTGPDSSIRRNSRSDIMGPILESWYMRRALLGNLPEEPGATSV